MLSRIKKSWGRKKMRLLAFRVYPYKYAFYVDKQPSFIIHLCLKRLSLKSYASTVILDCKGKHASVFLHMTLPDVQT